MKISLDLGHGVGQDRGAVGFIQEESIINEVGNKVKEKLRALGHEVILVRPGSASTLSDSLYKRCEKANDNNCDINLSIHANAGGGRGTEIFTYHGKEVDWARRILNNIVALGFVNRGLKNANLYMTNHTNMTSALLEICFVDTQSDVDLYKKIGAEAIADAIVKGLVGNTVKASVVNSKPKQNKKTNNISTHLKAWQEAFNMSFNSNILVDGIMGEQTECAMYNSYLRLGSNNVLVGWLQCRLHITIDNDFGQKTLKAVRNFQRENGLVVDGIVGYNTWNALLKKYNW